MRTCGPWGMRPRNLSSSRMPRVLNYLKAITPSARSGRGEGVSGGVFDHGTHEEDGPVTWEALVSPRHFPVSRTAGDPSPTHATLRVHVSSAIRHRTSTRIEVGHTQGEPERWPKEAGSRRA